MFRPWSGRSPAPVTTAEVNQRPAQMSLLRRVNSRRNYINNYESRSVRGARASPFGCGSAALGRSGPYGGRRLRDGQRRRLRPLRDAGLSLHQSVLLLEPLIDLPQDHLRSAYPCAAWPPSAGGGMANPEHYVRRCVSLEGETMLRFYQGLRKVGQIMRL